MRAAILMFSLAACGTSKSSTTVDSPPGGTRDAPSHTIDGPPGGTSDAPASQVDGQTQTGNDGTPMRLPCTSTFGTGLGSNFGRLDGYLVAIVQPGSTTCHGDSGHIHLQVQANGQIFDVAVNVGTTTQADVHTETKDLPFAPWSEGWHDGVPDDYVALGVHSTDVPAGSPQANTAAVNADLATVNHITIFATPYSTSGAHLVHRSKLAPGSADGLIVTQPLSSPAHARFFWFDSESF